MKKLPLNNRGSRFPDEPFKARRHSIADLLDPWVPALHCRPLTFTIRRLDPGGSSFKFFPSALSCSTAF